MKQVYLSLGAVIRDQEHYVKEWLSFHHQVGVKRFILGIRSRPFETKGV